MAITRKRDLTEHNEFYDNDKTERSLNQSFSASRNDDIHIQRDHTSRNFDSFSREDFIRGEA